MYSDDLTIFCLFRALASSATKEMATEMRANDDKKNRAEKNCWRRKVADRTTAVNVTYISLEREEWMLILFAFVNSFSLSFFLLLFVNYSLLCSLLATFSWNFFLYLMRFSLLSCCCCCYCCFYSHFLSFRCMTLVVFAFVSTLLFLLCTHLHARSHL